MRLVVSVRRTASFRSLRTESYKGLLVDLPIAIGQAFTADLESARQKAERHNKRATALIVQYIVPGYWYIIVGALAGAVSGGFIDDRK